MTRLSNGQRSMLRLIYKDQCKATGWGAPVSEQVLPIVLTLPSELIEVNEKDMQVRLSALGLRIHEAMEYL